MIIGQRNKESTLTIHCLVMHLKIIDLNLRLQTSTPSDHLCSTLLLPSPPQFLNQAPPGAQQLTVPDFRNVPHLGHVIVRSVVDVTDGVLIGFLTMSSRSVIGERDTCCCVVGADLHAVRDIDPDGPANINMSFLLAFELTQAIPQSFCLNEAASKNMQSILITLDTSHLDRSQLNALV